MRIAYFHVSLQPPEQLVPGQSTTQFDQLNKKCVQLLKIALKPEIWGHTVTLNLKWMQRILEMAEHQPRADQAQAVRVLFEVVRHFD